MAESHYPYTADELKAAQESKSEKEPVRKKGNGKDKDAEIKPKPRKFKYNKSFQIKILGLLIKDHDFLAYACPYIQPEHFTDKVLARIFSTIKSIHEKHRCGVSHVALTNELKRLKDTGKIEKEEARYYAKTLTQMMKPMPEAEYIRDQIQGFILHMNMEVGLLGGVRFLKKRQYDKIVEWIHTSYEDALLSNSKDYSPLDGKYLKERLKQRADMVEHPELFRGISTGISSLDGKMYWNGIGKKELGVVMAPPNGGKSPFLLHVATAAYLAGHTVVFYTLELDEYFFNLRLDANLTGYAINDLTKLKPEVVEKALEKRLKGCRGQLLVHDLSLLTPADVQRDITSYKKKGISPDLIVIDYADIMTPDTRAKERRHDFSAIYQGLRAIAKKENVAMWTASQANRESFKKNTMRMDSIAESWDKAMIADYIIGLSQTELDRKTTPQKLRLSLVKNRNGEKGIVVDTRVDFSRMKFDVVVSAEEAEEEEYGSLKPKIKEMIEDGCTVEEVVEKTKCNRSYYFKVKKEMKAEKEPSDEE